MDYARSFAISAIGMDIERARVDVAALNLANANTVRGPEGSLYQPLRVIAEAQGGAGGTVGLPVAAARFDALVSQGLAGHAGGAGEDAAAFAPPSLRIVPSLQPPRQAYEPTHPLADERGYVGYAGVDPATEMISLMSATRAYEANVSAMNTTRTLALRALDIGGNA